MSDDAAESLPPPAPAASELISEKPEQVTAPSDPAEDHPGETPKKLSRFERREKAATDALRTLIRDLYADRFMKETKASGELELTLSVKVDPRDDWALRFDPSFQDQLVRQLDDAEAGWGNWRDGFVYCFRCESNDCDCARAPSMLSVFNGYDSMGCPTWCEFAQVLIDAKHEEVDRLYQERGAPVLHHLQLGKELKQQQLASYGKSSKTYSVLGQVVAGYFRIPQAIRLREAGQNRQAITFQVVETRDRTGHFKLALNTVMGGLDVDQRCEFFASENLDWLFRAREVALRSLGVITQEAATAREQQDHGRVNQIMRRVPGVLRVLGQSIERGDRQKKRRTRHASERRAQGDRPTQKAIEDARKAGDESLFFDEYKKTRVVAPYNSGRAHVFNREARHVTSFRITQEGVDKRLQNKRWRHLNEEERNAFRSGLDSNPDTPTSDPV